MRKCGNGKRGGEEEMGEEEKEKVKAEEDRK